MNKVENLQYEYKHIALTDDTAVDKAYKFCDGYKKFIDECKTEREVTKFVIDAAIKNNYKLFDKSVNKLNPGDRFYVNNRDKSSVLITIGKKSLDEGVNFIVSHIDSPRLDLKANPMYEDSEIAYFKTHYYGGIKKYQWPTVPLSMHGKIFLENGETIDVNIGEKDTEPKFIITDLLPHLADKQYQKKANELIEGEDLNIVIGSIPFVDNNDKDIKNAVKLNVLKILNKTYGITEKDFVRSEIEFVPANKSSDIGFDKSMIAAYGQDDRVCAYPALMAELENTNPDLTSIAVFTDKEEIGSEGNTGMVSEYLFHIVEDLAEISGVKARDIYRKSICFSSDVNSAYDPSFSDVFEKRNCSYINKGVVITKYTGHRGKSGSNDASAETMAKVLKLMDDRQVVWQTGELGKVDIGGGGTIAKYMSQRNIDTVDIGVAVLSMHSPYELTSKLDIYHTYLAYKAFLLNK